MEYGNVSYHEALALPVDVFALMRKHAFIDRMRQTEEGQKYLDDCERLSKTEPDWGIIRNLPTYAAESEG